MGQRASASPSRSPALHAVGLGGRGHLADQLLAPRLGRQGDRARGQRLAAAGGDGELEARDEDADDHDEHMFALGVGRKCRTSLQVRRGETGVVAPLT